jgi:hypothetical protein
MALSHQYLLSILSYSKETGEFVWLIDSGRARRGNVSGHLRKDGYRWKNLRPASHSQNMANRKLNANSTSGFKGVSKRGGRYRSYVNKDGRRHYLGDYATPEEAALVAQAKAIELHGEFARAA